MIYIHVFICIFRLEIFTLQQYSNMNTIITIKDILRSSIPIKRRKEMYEANSIE